MNKDIEDMCEISRMCAEFRHGNRSLENILEIVEQLSNRSIMRYMRDADCLPNSANQPPSAAPTMVGPR